MEITSSNTYSATIKTFQPSSVGKSAPPEKVEPVQKIDKIPDVTHEPEIISYSLKNKSTDEQPKSPTKEELLAQELENKRQFPEVSRRTELNTEDYSNNHYVRIDRGKLISEYIQYPPQKYLQIETFRRPLIDEFI